MKCVATQRSGVKVFLLIAALLAVCFALSGCFDDYSIADYTPGHVHTYAIGDNDGDSQIRCGVPKMYLYEDLPAAFTEDVDPYNDNEIVGVSDSAYDGVVCGQIYPVYEMYHCTVCGTQIWRPNGQTQELSHNWSDWDFSRDATCTEPHKDSRSCSRCGEEEYRSVGEPLGHDYGTTDDVPATCTEEGRKANKKCKRCGHVHSGSVIPALGHDLVQHGAQAATCTTVGWDAYVTCSRCNYSTYAEKAALGHDWGDATYTWSDDHGKCTARHECRRCKYYEDVAAYAMAADTPATCTENAKTDYIATFAYPFKTQTVRVTAEGTAGHDWGDATYTWSEDRDTCTASRVCKRDGSHVETEKADSTVKALGVPCAGNYTAVYTAAFSNTGFQTQQTSMECAPQPHTPESIPAVPATCKKTGLSEGEKCSVCGEILVEQKETDIDPNNHEGPMVVALNADVPSTCTTKGYHTEGVCRACGVQVRTELEIDETNHLEAVVIPAVPATCMSTGLTEGTKCAACGKVLSGLAETPIDPDNHDWDEASYNWQDNGFCTAVRKCKLEGTHVQKITLPINVLSNTATCEQAGTVTYAADFGEPFAPQFKTSDAPALGHDWGEWDDSTATCTEVGTETRTCQRCSATETQNAAALGHTGGTATCTEQAVCTRCNQPYGEALGHDWGEWSQTKAPNCTEPGEQTRTCQRAGCGATEAEEISPVEGAHVAADPVQENAVAGTCQTEGSYDSVTYCAKCGTELSRETINTGKDASNHAGGTYRKYVEFVGEGKVAYYTFCSDCNAKRGEGSADAGEAPDDPDAWYREDDNDGGEGGGSDGISGEG